jgi:hypothetical protein
MIDIEFLKYPIGKFEKPERISFAALKEAIKEIKAFPGHLKASLSGLSEAQLDTPYRPGGWTVRHVAHHCADSHMNAYIRFKLALTEENPTVKGYDEGEWAKLPDKTLPVKNSIQLLELLHDRWGYLLENMKESDFQRTYFHPDKGRSQGLDEVTLMYSWHGNHHLAHVQHLIIREKW